MSGINVYYKQFASLPLFIGIALFQTSCQPSCQKMEPTISCPLPTQRIQTLPSAFPRFSKKEEKQSWAREILIGDAFARECDFYRAITSYKRALVLLPSDLTERRLQLDYDLIFCYYLGGKFQEALNIFGESDLSHADPSFHAFNQLLLIIYDCYLQTKQEDKAECLLEVIRKYSPESSDDLLLYQSLKDAEIGTARSLMSQNPGHEKMEREFAFYDQFAKSPRKARVLNAIFPGAGYYYVGQSRSALTSFLINALFTAAAYQFFQRGYPAAGAITASLELGWYFGGINGAGIEAQEFNARLYEGVSRKILTDHACFPVLMFETSF